MITSYAAMLETFQYIAPIKVLQMQALCRFMYDTGVARCQFTFKYVPVFCMVNLQNINTNHNAIYQYSKLHGFKRFQHESYDFYCKVTLLVRKHLYAFCNKEGTPLSITKYEDVTEAVAGKNLPRKILLSEGDQNHWQFSVTSYKRKAVFITGGKIAQTPSNGVLHFCLSTNTFTTCSLPAMTRARSFHSSTVVGDKLFVFGSMRIVSEDGSEDESNNPDKTIEFIDVEAHKKKWQGIETQYLQRNEIGPVVCTLSPNRVLFLMSNSCFQIDMRDYSLRKVSKFKRKKN